jgi:hypothetical protein
MNDNFVPTKAAVSVSEMARMEGLSRQRFYQLQGTAFPDARRDPDTGRPYYDTELQDVCLKVRKSHMGIDGRPILFYARRHPLPSRPKSLSKSKPGKPQHGHLVATLGELGLAVNPEQISDALRVVFPSGTDGTDPCEVIRRLFLHLKRLDSGVKGGGKEPFTGRTA